MPCVKYIAYSSKNWRSQKQIIFKEKREMKKLLCVIFAMVLALSAIGCGGGGGGSSGGGSDPNGEFAVSLGWMENPSGQRQRQSFEDAFKKFGISNYSIVDANYDAKKQSEQINAIIAKKPAALFITPSDPVGIADAVKKAADAGIKVYCSDGFVSGANIVSTVAFDNYAGGMFTMTLLGNKLNELYPTGDIEIALITLSANEGWDAREHGARYILSQPEYSRIKVTKEWPWDSTGAVTPRNAVDNFLAADPDKKLRAIWCAWDGAVFEGLEATASARPEILYTGSDGGRECFEKMAAYPDQFLMTVGESVYAMPELLVTYAMNFKNGQRVPRVVMIPGYGITSDLVRTIDSIRNYKVDGISMWDLLCDYDMPGYVDKINRGLMENDKGIQMKAEI
jgi:ribose transport system substrate-binding protein